jgi:pyridoxal phosphate enzyme (YggS family)
MISDNLDRIRERIGRACARAGRNPGEVTLVAIAKTFPSERIQDVIRAGVRDVGENYVQELLQKRAALSHEEVRWHFVGHLQSNKVKQIAGWVALIHAVDSADLVREIDRRAATAGRTIECLVEVNTTGERSKFGVPPDRTAALVTELSGCTNVSIDGLMTIGPFLPDPEGSRPMFRRLRELREEIAGLGIPNAPMRHLSMGMTGDFEVAIEEGATLIRIGTAIFGPRKKTAAPAT